MSVAEYGDVHIANCANDMMCLDITQMLLDSVQTGYELANFHLAFIHMNLTVFVVQALSGTCVLCKVCDSSDAQHLA